ncbi:hypothetical protein GCM10027271_40470 [Saccharopolyspora gloriosae]|uniref:Uncharacterized protein n=1 Tax=Saccharopolyspora gloriosae TaxID=455344 RepID=A0A840NBT3_9PSEU|nr:hypothetical protein [Saccharopolyspora gloriosae]MBB5069064.1 hypothetical protein [Saccharopolyspora gloriosae]
MSSSVSVPEKTLEHWASQYVTYRYASKAALWWPTTGEDLELGWLPPKPGKSVRLELKTTTLSPSGSHAVKIDIRQLWKYQQLPQGHQPFYVFPCPFWEGELHKAASAAHRKVTELGFSRSGRRWWFAEWMVVLTAAQVANVFRPELRDYARTRRDATRTLVSFAPNDPTPRWHVAATPKPNPVPWRKFWTVLERCGYRDWPQLIRVPQKYFTSKHELFSYGYVLEMMQAAAEAGDYGQLVTLAPSENAFHVVPSFTTGLADDAEEITRVSENRPLGVHLDITALSWDT